MEWIVDKPSTPAGLRALAAALLALTCILAWGNVARIVSSDFADFGSAEPFVVYTLASMKEGRSLYPRIDEPPFVVTQYTPLFYLVCYQACLFTNFSSPHEITQVARIVSSLSWTAVCLVVAFVWVRIFGHPWLPAFGACLFVFVSSGLFPFQARPDSLEVLCSIVSILLMIVGISQSKNTAWCLFVLSGALGCLATFAKQNGAQALIFAVVSGIASRQRRIPLAFSVGFFLGSAVTFFPAWMCYGGALFQHTINGVNNGINLTLALSKTYYPLLNDMGAILAVGLSLGFLELGARDPRHRILAALTLCSLVLSLLAGLKYGSSENYFMEFSVLTAMLVGAVLPSWESHSRKYALAVGLALVVIMACALPLKTIIAETRSGRYDARDLSSLMSFLAEKFLQDPDALVFSSDTRIPVLIPKRVAVGQVLLVTLMHQRGLVNYRAFFDLIGSGRLRYHIIDLRIASKEHVYRDPTNLEYHLRNFVEVGVQGPFLILENPIAHHR